MRLISDFFNVILDSDEFFHSKEGDKWTWAFTYFLFISLIGLGLNLVLFWNGIMPAGLLAFDTILQSAQLQMLLYIFFLLGFPLHLLYAGLLYTVLGKRTPLRQVYKCSVYGFTPSMISLWIPVVGPLLLIWSVYITVMGLNIYNKEGIRKNFWRAFGAGVVVAIIAVSLTLLFGALIAQRTDFWNMLLTDMKTSVV